MKCSSSCFEPHMHFAISKVPVLKSICIWKKIWSRHHVRSIFVGKVNEYWRIVLLYQHTTLFIQKMQIVGFFLAKTGLYTYLVVTSQHVVRPFPPMGTCSDRFWKQNAHDPVAQLLHSDSIQTIWKFIFLCTNKAHFFAIWFGAGTRLLPNRTSISVVTWQYDVGSIDPHEVCYTVYNVWY